MKDKERETKAKARRGKRLFQGKKKRRQAKANISTKTRITPSALTCVMRICYRFAWSLVGSRLRPIKYSANRWGKPFLSLAWLILAWLGFCLGFLFSWLRLGLTLLSWSFSWPCTWSWWLSCDLWPPPPPPPLVLVIVLWPSTSPLSIWAIIHHPSRHTHRSDWSSLSIQSFERVQQSR